jgi:cation diffusion facilitator family transporter
LNEGSRASVLAALTANAVIAVTKLIAAAVSGSTAMLAEGIHSVADTGNQLLLLLGLRRSKRPPDEEHPFGHGMERFFWTFVVALTLFSVGGLVSVTRGVSGLRHQEETPGLWLGLIVLLVAAVFEGSALRIALKTFNRDRGRRSFYAGLRRAKDPETLTVVFEDTAALTGIATAIAGLVLAHVFDDSRWDAGAAIVIGLLLMVVAFALARESRDLLLGESAAPERRRAIREAVEAHDDVDEIRDLLTMHVGPEEILVNIEIAFRDGLDTDGVEDAIRAVEAAVMEAVPQVGRIFVEPRRPVGATGGPAGDPRADRRP